MNIDGILVELNARGVEADDLSELLHELAMESSLAGIDRAMPESEMDALVADVASKAESITNNGLRAQVDYLASYFGNERDLRLALSGFFALPEVCHA